MTEETKRYGLDLDMYIYAKNDTEAKAFISTIVTMLNQKFDNSTRAKRLVEIPFGSLTARPVEL